MGKLPSPHHSKNTAQTDLTLHYLPGNCPKYLNSKTITPATPHPVLLSSSPTLTPTARALIAKADLFFISSANATTHDMDVNHRGGPAGFVRILPSSDPSSPTTLVYPEYSGNRLYQTLGNLHTTPLAGLCFPDFATGDVLYATGTARIHAGKAAAALLPRSTLAVAVTLTAARLVRRGLPFRGTPAAAGAGNAAAVPKTGTDEEKKMLGMSPYNPPVRLLAAEGNLLSSAGQQAQEQEQEELTATLSNREAITPGPASIARFTFALSAPAAVARGQWVALDASNELDAGYSHMRDDDPASLNDDFVRTFTVTWADGWDDGDEGVVVRPSTQFAITVRRHGPVTGLLFNTSERAGLVLPVRGFGGGEFRVRAAAGATAGLTPFVAGGVGVTPLLAELAGASGLDPASVALFWTLRRADAALVGDVFRRWPGLARGARVFLTTRGGGGGGGGDGDGDVDGVVEGLRGQAAVVEGRRLEEDDLREVESERWYLCAGTALHKQVVAWLAGRGEVVSESFNF
ncbi:hypothetical protein SLS55_009117 [Diplodia seriata]|uniref:FAD-binding FR-type domain-containing protein n=1 Tax=Diplodia seriata TaxID=420778 RepID=A0ABR3C7V6_9PEZI